MDNLSNISELIRRVNAGEPGAQDTLFAAAYGELRKLPRARLRDGGRNGARHHGAGARELPAVSASRPVARDDRRAFFAYASRVMRSVIIDAVRERQAERQAERRGGDLQRLTLNTQIADSVPSGEDEMLQVHEALDALAQAEPRLAKVVEMLYFGGCCVRAKCPRQTSASAFKRAARSAFLAGRMPACR